MFISGKIVAFALGSIFGASIIQSLKSKKIRSCCVKVIGKGLILKNEAMAMIESAKEGAEDLVAEAKTQNEKSTK